MKLHDIAHARAGDKGDTSDITIFAFDPRDYPLIAAEVTIDRVQRHFAAVALGKIERYALPQLGAIKFVLHGALGGGVTRSLALDAHGKCYSSLLLDMEISADAFQFSARPNVARASRPWTALDAKIMGETPMPPHGQDARATTDSAAVQKTEIRRIPADCPAEPGTTQTS